MNAASRICPRTVFALPVRFPAPLDYSVEMALQGGRQEAIRAWAGRDGRHTTFDDAYPAGYNKYGMADPLPGAAFVLSGVEWIGA